MPQKFPASEISGGKISGNLTVNQDVTIDGNLTVNGTTITMNSTTLTVDDKNIELASTASPSDALADGGGITLKASTDITIQWLNATNAWTFNQSIDLLGNNLISTGSVNVGRVLVDNLQLDANTLSSTDINGDILLTPNGTGNVVISNQLIIEGSTSQLLLNDTDNDKTYILKSNLGDFSIVEIGGNNVFKILSGAAANSLQINVNQVDIGTRLSVDNLRLDDNTISSTDVNGNILLTPNGTGKVGVGTTSPNAQLEVGGTSGTSVGGFPSGNLHVTGQSALVNTNAVITGHNLFGGNKQLWYLGSISGSNDNIAFINRQNGSLSLNTNSLSRLTVSSDGNVTINGFTKLGSTAPNVKMKKLTGTTGATEGSTTSIAHGLTLSKIIGFNVLVTASNGNSITHGLTFSSEFEYDQFIDATNVVIRLSGTNSGNLLSQAIKVLLVFEE